MAATKPVSDQSKYESYTDAQLAAAGLKRINGVVVSEIADSNSAAASTLPDDPLTSSTKELQKAQLDEYRKKKDAEKQAEVYGRMSKTDSDKERRKAAAAGLTDEAFAKLSPLRQAQALPDVRQQSTITHYDGEALPPVAPGGVTYLPDTTRLQLARNASVRASKAPAKTHQENLNAMADDPKVSGLSVKLADGTIMAGTTAAQRVAAANAAAGIDRAVYNQMDAPAIGENISVQNAGPAPVSIWNTGATQPAANAPFIPAQPEFATSGVIPAAAPVLPQEPSAPVTRGVVGAVGDVAKGAYDLVTGVQNKFLDFGVNQGNNRLTELQRVLFGNQPNADGTPSRVQTADDTAAIQKRLVENQKRSEELIRKRRAARGGPLTL